MCTTERAHKEERRRVGEGEGEEEGEGGREWCEEVVLSDPGISSSLSPFEQALAIASRRTAKKAEWRKILPRRARDRGTIGNVT